MTAQSTHKIIKAQLPEPYYSLTTKYIRKNKTASSLSEALRLTIPWHPNATDEGYQFWEAVYYWASGARKRLPRVHVQTKSKCSYSYDNRYNLCHVETGKIIEIVEELFGCIGLNRIQPNVYKRYIVFSHLIDNKADLFTLQMIGAVVAEQLGRKVPFDHATILHAKRNDEVLIETNEPTYTNMKRLFKLRLEELYSNNDN